jgi:hypothetical protein
MAVAKKEATAPRKYNPKVVGAVDSTVEDVLKWNQEGRVLFFLDDEETFLGLAPDEVKQLSLENRKRYDVARGIARGDDVMGTVTADIKGYEETYNVRPGSADDNLSVYGQKPGETYYWERPENIGRRKAEGWGVNTDSDISTSHKESCSHHTVGGEAKSELVLLSRPKSVQKAEDAKNRAQRDRLINGAKDSFRRGVEKMGAIPIEDK